MNILCLKTVFTTELKKIKLNDDHNQKTHPNRLIFKQKENVYFWKREKKELKEKENKNFKELVKN